MIKVIEKLNAIVMVICQSGKIKIQKKFFSQCKIFT